MNTPSREVGGVGHSAEGSRLPLWFAVAVDQVQ